MNDGEEKFIFKYNDGNIDLSNINNIILDKNIVKQLKPMNNNLVYEHYSNSKPSYFIQYKDDIDQLFIKNINFIEKKFIGFSRIDGRPMFVTKMNYSDYKFLLRKEKIKRFLEVNA